MKVLIIDDEKHCRSVIKTYLESLGNPIENIEEAWSVDSGYQKILNFKPTVVFLDIQLSNKTGFDILDCIPEQNFHLIFTTAYDNYAIKAFEYAALHYLLKPVNKKMLIEALDRVRESKDFLKTEQIDQFKFLYVNTENRSFNLDLSKVAYLEADGSYSRIFMKNGESVFSSKNLGEYEKKLPENFFRVHKSFIVNLLMVERVESSKNCIQLSNNTTLTVSRRKKPLLITTLKTLQKNNLLL